MKKLFKVASTILLAILYISTLQSCKKDDDEGILPNIYFKTGSEYVSSDITVVQDSTLKIGIIANKTEDKDVLTKFTITRTYDNGTESTVYTEDLSGSKGDNYAYDHTLTTRSQSGTEKYTFVIINRDGLINKVAITITVQ